MSSNSLALALLPEKYLKVGLQLDRAGQQTLFLLQLGRTETCECEVCLLASFLGQLSLVIQHKLQLQVEVESGSL